MYVITFEGLGLTHDELQSSPHPFYGVIPSKQFVPLKWDILSVTFGDTSNYRTETLTFEVVDFSGPYHISLGRPSYVKFMAIPNPPGLSPWRPRHSGHWTVSNIASSWPPLWSSWLN
jgi:hypothetical protein